MGKKEEIKVNVYDPEVREKGLAVMFLESMVNNGLSIDGNILRMETDDAIYTIEFDAFIMFWKSRLERIYAEDLPMIFKPENVNSREIGMLYGWLDPVFEQFPIKIENREPFIHELKEKLETDANYYMSIRLATLDKLEALSWKDSVAFLDRFIPYGILVEEDKIQFGYYAKKSPEELQQLFEEKQFSKRDMIEVVSQAVSVENEKQEDAKAKGKKSNNNRRTKLINLLPPDEILDTFINDVLSLEELLKTKITKQDMLDLPYDMLSRILYEKNDNLPDRLRITSKDLVNQYGRNLTGLAIYRLAEDGFILPEDLIEVYEINKALMMTEFEEFMIEEDELDLSYSPDVLLDLKARGKLTPRFLQVYMEMEDFENSPKNFRTKSQAIVEELEKRLKDSDKKIEDEVLELFEIGLCDSETAREKVSEEYLEEKFFNDELTVEQIFEYYKKGIISEEAVLKYYSKEELFELYESGKVSRDCLKAIKDVDFLLQRFCDGRIEEADFLGLYLNSGTLSVTDLEEGLGIAEKEIDIFGFIDENTPFIKIKEMYMAYLIDYSTILRLHNQGIIDKDQLEELKSALNTKEFFEELKSGKTYRVLTEREKEGASRKPIVPKDVIEKDYTDELRLISELLEKDILSEKTSLITSYNSRGKTTTLHNYRIFGNEELDGIVVLQKSKNENAIYVTSAPQMMYFLHGKENSEGQIEVKDRMKDKAYLRTIEGVEVVEHSEYFARNLVEAASRISPKIAERVKIKRGKYVQEVDEMVKSMREKYLEAKAKGRDED